MGRRHFVQGLALGAGALGIGGLGMSPAKLLASQGQTGAATLSGNTFNLAIGGADVNITGTTRPATLVNASLPAPTPRPSPIPLCIRRRTERWRSYASASH